MNVSSLGNPAAHIDVPAQPSQQPAAALQNQRALVQAVRAVNATALFGQDNELTFVLDRNTKKAIVRIVNRQTREVVRQIPTESVLQMAEENNVG